MKINLTTINDEYCVYSYTINDDELLYVGCCKTFRLLEFKDAKANLLFRQITRINPKATVKIEFRCENVTDARMYQEMLVAMKSPPCNRNYKAAYSEKRGQPVQCNETGITYKNATEAARDHHVSLATMSNHLAGRKGYGKVKGRTFVRC